MDGHDARLGRHRSPEFREFVPEGKAGTRVELEHRHLDRYGARRDEMRRIFDSSGDWGRLLGMFAQLAAAHV